MNEVLEAFVLGLSVCGGSALLVFGLVHLAFWVIDRKEIE